MSRLPTLAQVAAAAGVSPATASRALNGSALVSTATRLQVYDAVSRLGYVRQRATRSPSVRPMIGGVAALVCDHMPRLFSEPFYARFLSAAEVALGEHGSHLIVATVQPTAVSLPVLGGGTDGVLLIGARERHPLAIDLFTSGVPVCSIGRPPHDLRLPFVDADNKDGGRQAAEHLLQKGRRVFGAISGPPSLPGARDRLAGFGGALRAAGVEGLTVAYGDFSAASGTHAMRWLLRQIPDVDAVFAASDLMAAGAMHVLARAGRKVPEDVAVIGFDDSPIAQRTAPALTTVRQPVEDVAVAAVQRLLFDGPMGQTLPVELVVRASA